MRIFSNFDTQIKENTTAEYQAQYGAENVLCFGRSKLYRILKIFFPTTFIVLFDIGVIYAINYASEGEYLIYIVIAVVIISLIFIGPILNRYIEYKMDFIIVTPDLIILYDQAGLFSKKVVTVNEKSIKTISVEKKGILYSIFNNGDIIFLAEGDVTEHGDITLRWIPKPEKRRDQIATIMKKE